MGRGKAKKQKSKNGQDRWIEVSKEGLKDLLFFLLDMCQQDRQQVVRALFVYKIEIM